MSRSKYNRSNVQQSSPSVLKWLSTSKDETERGNESTATDTDDGQDLFNRSPSPEETFSDAEGANSDGEWPLEIIGEEVDYLGEIKYEVKWDGWRRNTDGTNTTWDNSLVPPAVIQEWNRRREKRRLYKAQKKFLGVEIQPSIRFTDLPTLWRYEAMEERMELHLQNNYSLLHDLIRAKKKAHNAHDHGVNSTQRRSSRLQSTRSSNSSTPKAAIATHDAPVTIKTEKRRRVDDSPIPESPPLLIESSAEEIEKLVMVPIRIGPPSKRVKVEGTSQKPKPYGQSCNSHEIKSKDPYEDSKDIFASLAPPQMITRHTNKRRFRNKLADDWTEVAKASGAAYITFTNEIDTEETPQLSPDFRYIEKGYTYSHDVPKASDLDDAIFLRCNCQRGCNDPEDCGCQQISDLVDDSKEKVIAYDAKGLFMIDITPGMLVVECNQYCKCNLSCRNRASQRPRKIPIDIFKTVNRGWGARPLRDVPMGSVLGIYSGKLIKRDEAEKLEGERREYCFDLDGQENLFKNVKEQQGTYTVDASNYGNWTRFVNHSCSPNLQVYQAIHNTIPELNTPFIIFCAKTDIPANCELTVDYDPRETHTVKRKRKGRRRSNFEIPEGAIQCRCGEKECRQWVRVLA